jgi:hypothetical protein
VLVGWWYAGLGWWSALMRRMAVTDSPPRTPNLSKNPALFRAKQLKFELKNSNFFFVGGEEVNLPQGQHEWRHCPRRRGEPPRVAAAARPPRRGASRRRSPGLRAASPRRHWPRWPALSTACVGSLARRGVHLRWGLLTWCSVQL